METEKNCLANRTNIAYDRFIYKTEDEMNRDSLKQILIDWKETYLSNPLIMCDY